jgi:hypothetical protein
MTSGEAAAGSLRVDYVFLAQRCKNCGTNQELLVFLESPMGNLHGSCTRLSIYGHHIENATSRRQFCITSPSFTAGYFMR